MFWQDVQGIARHVMTFGGGFLVTNGTMSEAQLDTGIGALVTLLGLAWSLYDKHHRRN